MSDILDLFEKVIDIEIFNWRQEILTELARSEHPSHLMFSQGSYIIYSGKYRRGGEGETLVPPDIVKKMVKDGELRIVNYLNLPEYYSLVLVREKKDEST